MATRILLIEADHAFGRDLATALATRGVETRLCTDGQNGLEEARSWRPDVVVLCVELPNLSGYSVCNKLKKDDQLKSIPLILTSAEATPETFEQHRKLRTRADEYLLKPFNPATLVRTIGQLIALPPGGEKPASFEGLGQEDLELINRVFDEFAAGGAGDAGAPEGPITMPAATVVAWVDRSSAGTGGANGITDGLRARVAELESELERVRATLQESNAERTRLQAMERSMQDAVESARNAVERATTAEARLGNVEQRLRTADALRDKARRALAVVLQALEEPTQRANPTESPPRRE